MPYPPVPSPAQYFIAEGSLPTTLVWGTQDAEAGLIGAGTYIVKSARFTLRVEEIDIEQGSGFEATVILLIKGQDVEFTVVDDAAVTPPSPGDVVTLTNSPYSSTVAFLVINSAVNMARKAEGERVISAKSFNAITL